MIDADQAAGAAPLAAPTGLTMLGATDQGSCADGSCAVPTLEAPS